MEKRKVSAAATTSSLHTHILLFPLFFPVIAWFVVVAGSVIPTVTPKFSTRSRRIRWMRSNERPDWIL